MVGSWVGRALVALLGLLASVAVGLIIAGVTGEVGVAAAVVAVLSGLVLLRVCRVGVIIDLDAEQLVLLTFWRTRRIPVDELHRVDAPAAGDSWPPGVRFVTTDGREYASLALCYLDEPRAVRFIGQLEAVVSNDAEVSLEPSSFRPPVR